MSNTTISKDIRDFLASLGNEEAARQAALARKPSIAPPKLAENVRATRLAQGWSQETLAQKAGIAGCTVSKIEKGSPAKRSTLAKLARALRVSIDELTGTEASPENASGEKVTP